LIALRTLARPSFTECYLTAVGQADRSLDAASAIFEEVATALCSTGAQPIQEKIYGPVQQRGELLAVRQSIYQSLGLSSALPCTFIDGKPGDHRGPLAVQLWGVIPAAGSDSSVASVALTGGRQGRLLTAPGLRLLLIPEVTGVDPKGQLAPTASAQAAQMFSNADRALSDQGFAFGDVARTWLYLRRLLDWYGELNAVRTAFFDQRNITGRPPGHPFPASTGIQGTSAGEECVMDVLAIQVEESLGTVRPVNRSSRQTEPFCYGSAFSRAMAFAAEDAQTILVSGTASIDSAGRSLHRGNPEAQILETLLSIAALLEPAGARLQDIGAGTLFYKDAESRRVYEQVTTLLGVPKLPLVPVLADVCRDELLVEIEAVALVSPPTTTNDQAGEGTAP
jgi:enamine deaminase RidA (YjgF/YER057c/UK114 family)